MKKLSEIFEASKKLGFPLTVAFTIVAVTFEISNLIGGTEND